MLSSPSDYEVSRLLQEAISKYSALAEQEVYSPSFVDFLDISTNRPKPWDRGLSSVLTEPDDALYWALQRHPDVPPSFLQARFLLAIKDVLYRDVAELLRTGRVDSSMEDAVAVQFITLVKNDSVSVEENAGILALLLQNDSVSGAALDLCAQFTTFSYVLPALVRDPRVSVASLLRNPVVLTSPTLVSELVAASRAPTSQVFLMCAKHSATSDEVLRYLAAVPETPLDDLVWAKALVVAAAVGQPPEKWGTTSRIRWMLRAHTGFRTRDLAKAMRALIRNPGFNVNDAMVLARHPKFVVTQTILAALLDSPRATCMVLPLFKTATRWASRRKLRPSTLTALLRRALQDEDEAALEVVAARDVVDLDVKFVLETMRREDCILRCLDWARDHTATLGAVTTCMDLIARYHTGPVMEWYLEAQFGPGGSPPQEVVREALLSSSTEVADVLVPHLKRGRAVIKKLVDADRVDVAMKVADLTGLRPSKMLALVATDWGDHAASVNQLLQSAGVGSKAASKLLVRVARVAPANRSVIHALLQAFPAGLDLAKTMAHLLDQAGPLMMDVVWDVLVRPEYHTTVAVLKAALKHDAAGIFPELLDRQRPATDLSALVVKTFVKLSGQVYHLLRTHRPEVQVDFRALLTGDEGLYVDLQVPLLKQILADGAQDAVAAVVAYGDTCLLKCMGDNAWGQVMVLNADPRTTLVARTITAAMEAEKNAREIGEIDLIQPIEMMTAVHEALTSPKMTLPMLEEMVASFRLPGGKNAAYATELGLDVDTMDVSQHNLWMWDVGKVMAMTPLQLRGLVLNNVVAVWRAAKYGL
jgi:hypothetical protein